MLWYFLSLRSERPSDTLCSLFLFLLFRLLGNYLIVFFSTDFLSFLTTYLQTLIIIFVILLTVKMQSLYHRHLLIHDDWICNCMLLSTYVFLVPQFYHLQNERIWGWTSLNYFPTLTLFDFLIKFIIDQILICTTQCIQLKKKMVRVCKTKSKFLSKQDQNWFAGSLNSVRNTLITMQTISK